jgi:transcriptional repressor NrdR
MMKCPYCRTAISDVFNSRSTKFGTQIWRRRRCQQCGRSFTTYEAADLGFLQVVKKQGKSERYSRAKLFSSVYAAFLDVAGKQHTIDAVTETIEAKLLDLQSSPISTEEIAAVVLQTLKHYYTTAFVRYLSHKTNLTSEAQLRKELKKY